MVGNPAKSQTVFPECENAPGGGALTQADPGPPAPPAKTSKLILLVEDHIDSAIMFKQLLELSGYAVVWAETVETAKDISDHHPLDLLVSDINLPDGTGHEIMRHISAHKRIPGVAISALSGPDDMERSINAGFTVHLSKPISPCDLRQLIEKFLPPE